MTRHFAALLAFLCLAESVWARQPFRAKNAIVVAEEPIAADVGATILKSGGNAVDAAVAVALALAVTYPVAGNLGGGGFLLARFADGRSTFIDFRERAPQKSSRDMYLDPKASSPPTALKAGERREFRERSVDLNLPTRSMEASLGRTWLRHRCGLREKAFRFPTGLRKH